MSADHWGECPRCRAQAIVEHAQRRQAALDSYGKVTPEEYSILCLEMDKPVAENETFREDYEIGLYKDGTFRVDYGGGCAVCGLNFEYKHGEKVKM